MAIQLSNWGGWCYRELLVYEYSVDAWCLVGVYYLVIMLLGLWNMLISVCSSAHTPEWIYIHGGQTPQFICTRPNKNNNRGIG